MARNDYIITARSRSVSLVSRVGVLADGNRRTSRELEAGAFWHFPDAVGETSARLSCWAALRNEFSTDTLRKWIDPDTGKLKFPRFHDYNLEERTVAGADLFRIRYYKTMIEASKALRVSYQRLRSRVQGHQPVQANGGHNKALSPEEEAEVLMWAHRRITQGHHIKGPALVQHANAIFAARGDCRPHKHASHRWAHRFIKRNAHIFKLTATHSRDARRKAGAIRATIDSFYS
ncbi:hypothetical protein E4U56_003293 [Claviceps arundinis]|uniref:HTH CENPB-type domain-containing protein n=1 Tax=Claviceps arundinis TaxID=1623583 RepID=A0A9P7MN58_9HYPO|nr:hypothetical protein E4U56_003293 [Claviceps arundinis]